RGTHGSADFDGAQDFEAVGRLPDVDAAMVELQPVERDNLQTQTLCFRGPAVLFPDEPKDAAPIATNPCVLGSRTDLLAIGRLRVGTPFGRRFGRGWSRRGGFWGGDRIRGRRRQNDRSDGARCRATRSTSAWC